MGHEVVNLDNVPALFHHTYWRSLQGIFTLGLIPGGSKRGGNARALHFGDHRPISFGHTRAKLPGIRQKSEAVIHMNGYRLGQHLKRSNAQLFRTIAGHYLTDEDIPVDCLDRAIDLSNSCTLYVGKYASDQAGLKGSYNVHVRNTWCAECGRSSPYGFDFCVNDFCRCPITLQGGLDVVRTTRGEQKDANRRKYLHTDKPQREKRGKRSYDPLSNAHIKNYIKRAIDNGCEYGHVHRYDADEGYRADMDRNGIPRLLCWKYVNDRTGFITYQQAENENYPRDRDLRR